MRPLNFLIGGVDMDVANEILDAIEIIVDKKIREQATQIYSGICKNVNGDSCVMFINGKNNTVQFYGPTPIVGAIYKVFVPYGNMSSAFAITGIVAKSDDEDDKKDLYYSNPNLLDNWYFGNPVNQRGETEYTESGYTFDRWLLNQWNTTSKACSVATNGLRVYGEASSSCSTSIKQFVECLKAGCQVTASVLVTDFTAGAAVYLFIRTNSGVRLARVRFSKPGLYSVTTTLPDNFEGNLMIEIGQGGSDGGNGNTDFTVLATKLELGSQQTLAHQDADGNWVLNEIPDYGEQLRRCQRYFVNFNPNKAYWFAMPPAVASNATDAYSAVTLPVAMRAQPTVSYGGKIALSQTGDVQVTGIQVSGNTFTGNYLQLNYSVADGLTASSTYRVQGYNDPTSYIWLSADL